MTAPTITALPTPPSRQDPETFSDRSDAFLGALPTFQSELNTLGDYVETTAAEVDADATAAAASATSAAASASAASQEAAAWVSGASYTVGTVVYSTITYSTYRAITTHSGVTDDPSVDGTNWINISGVNELSGFGVTATAAELNVLDGVTATTAELNYNDITTLGTSEASKVLTADANGNIKLTEEVQATCYLETAVSVPSTAIDCDEGNLFYKTISANTTFTFDYSGVNLTTDDAYGFTLILTVSGTRTVTWPASVDWAGGTAPDAPADGETDVYVFATRDGGTTWYGFQAGDAMA